MDDQERKVFIEMLIAFKRFWFAKPNTTIEATELEDLVASLGKLRELDK